MTSPNVPPPRFAVSLTKEQWAIVCVALEEWSEVCDDMPAEQAQANETQDEVEAQLRAHGITSFD